MAGWRIPLLILALTAAGCGGGGGAKINGVTQAQLNGVLLTAADVPPGYRLDKSKTTTATPAGSVHTADCAGRFAGLGDLAAGTGTILSARARYQGPQLGTVLQESLTRIARSEDAQARLAAVAAVISNCPNFAIAGGGVPELVSLSTLPLGTIGDQSYSYSVSVKSGSSTYAAYEVVAAVGRSVVVIAEGGLSAPDQTLTVSSARAAVKRLRTLPS